MELFPNASIPADEKGRGQGYDAAELLHDFFVTDEDGVVDPEVAGDVEMLQDMVMAAVNEAVKKVEEESQSKMGGMLGGMGLPPGLF